MVRVYSEMKRYEFEFTLINKLWQVKDANKTYPPSGLGRAIKNTWLNRGIFYPKSEHPNITSFKLIFEVNEGGKNV